MENFPLLLLLWFVVLMVDGFYCVTDFILPLFDLLKSQLWGVEGMPMFWTNFLLCWKEFFPEWVSDIYNTHVTVVLHQSRLCIGMTGKLLQLSIAVQNPKMETVYIK